MAKGQGMVEQAMEDHIPNPTILAKDMGLNGNPWSRGIIILVD